MLRLPWSKPGIEGNISDKQPVQLDRAHLTPDTRHNLNKVLVCLNCGTNGHFVAACPMKLDTASKNSSLPRLIILAKICLCPDTIYWSGNGLWTRTKLYISHSRCKIKFTTCSTASVRFSYEWFQSTRYPQTWTRNADLLQHLCRTNKSVSVRSSTHPFSSCSTLAQLPQPKYSLEQKQHLRMEFKLPSIMCLKSLV